MNFHDDGLLDIDLSDESSVDSIPEAKGQALGGHTIKSRSREPRLSQGDVEKAITSKPGSSQEHSKRRKSKPIRRCRKTVAMKPSSIDKHVVGNSSVTSSEVLMDSRELAEDKNTGLHIPMKRFRTCSLNDIVITDEITSNRSDAEYRPMSTTQASSRASPQEMIMALDLLASSAKHEIPMLDPDVWSRANLRFAAKEKGTMSLEMIERRLAKSTAEGIGKAFDDC